MVRARMRVPGFENAPVASLKSCCIRTRLKTQLAGHVIKLDEKRQKEAPSSNRSKRPGAGNSGAPSPKHKRELKKPPKAADVDRWTADAS